MIRDQRRYDEKQGVSRAIEAIVEAVVPLKVDLTGLGNGADQTEDVLATFTIPAATMGANGVQGFRIEAWGHCATNGDNKTIKLYFDTVAISTGVITDSNKDWFLTLEVYRSGTNTQRVLGLGQHDTTAVTVLNTTGSATETGAIVAKATGQEGSANTANSITCTAFIVTAIEQKKTT